MRVLIVIITDNQVESACLQSVKAQDYEYIIVKEPSEKLDDHYIINKYKNCSRTREKARQQALKTQADAFLFLDSDIVIPSHTVTEFILQSESIKIQTGMMPITPGGGIIKMQKEDRKPRVLGGWYKVRNDPYGRYVAGKFVDDNVFINFRKPERSLIAADLVGLGCAFIPRIILEKVSFKHGCDFAVKNGLNGETMILGECGIFATDVQDAGYELFMDGDVVCEHLERNQEHGSVSAA